MKLGQAVEIMNKHKHDGRQWYVDKYGFACGPGGVLDNFFTPFEAVAIAEKLERRARRASGASPRERRASAPLRWTAEPPKVPGLYMLNYHNPSIGDGGYKAEFVGPGLVERCMRDPDWWEGITSFGPIPESAEVTPEDMR